MPKSQSNILQFWRNIEIFNLPDLDRKAIPLSSLSLLPWEDEIVLTNNKKVLRYTLFIGKAPKQKVIEQLGSILNATPNSQDWLDPVQGNTCLAALILDQDGRPDWNSYIQASFLHGIYCLLQKKPFRKIKELLATVQTDFESRFDIAKATAQELGGGGERKGNIVTKEILSREINELKKVVGKSFAFEEEIFVVAEEVVPNSEPDVAFLNSFYLEDLDALIDSSRSYGKALQEYLSITVNIERRQDVLVDKDALSKCLNPDTLPLGRWPSNIDYGLYTAQQAAVNSTILDLKSNTGIRGINGPPGTGKTTLLLDVVADVIVSRAERLMKTGVAGIFNSKAKKIQKENGFIHYYYDFENNAFEGFGIVVSSNNNAAVENITKELPSIDKIDLDTFGSDPDYFAECATRLLDKKESWGILSAALGNKVNRNKFKMNFWKSKGILPGFEEILGKAYQEEDRTAEYSEKFEETREELEEMIDKFRQFQEMAGRLSGNVSAGAVHTRSARLSPKKYDQIRDEIEGYYGITPNNIVDECFFKKNHEDIHLSTPYSSGYINELRSRILLKSLDLHKYAILSNAKHFRNNLNLFFEMLRGNVPVTNDTGLILWNTFFFCVPVVSTTLASVSRLFKNVGKEAIGWLLLDEAGQATPQSVVGMLWRSKRCIVVGDPLQIKPVITHPEHLINVLRKEQGIEDMVWSPLASSAQTLADRVSVRGTYMGDAESPTWSGFPLRAHRRCDSPMFDISNRIAYENQMVKAKKDQPFKCALGKSCWFDITGSSIENRHVVLEEIEFLKNRITDVISSGYDKDIFVISPFLSVKNACEEALEHLDMVKCGTVHTFQGKEAEIVFLVLGSDPGKPGARLWVTQSPNMLNVAITRAKKRFFVIGNVKLWGELEFMHYFKEMLLVHPQEKYIYG